MDKPGCLVINYVYESSVNRYVRSVDDVTVDDRKKNEATCNVVTLSFTEWYWAFSFGCHHSKDRESSFTFLKIQNSKHIKDHVTEMYYASIERIGIRS